MSQSQSRIHSFFTAVPDDAYTAQLQRECNEHSAARELQLCREALVHARHCLQREAGEKRGVGRPRKRAVALISIDNSTNCNISTGDIILLPDSPVQSDGELSSELSSESAASTVSTTATTATTASTDSTSSSVAASVATAKRRRIDWLAKPELASQIIAAVKVHQSFQRAVTALQQDEKLAGVFDALNESTVRQWYKKRSFTLALSTERRLAGCITPRAGRPSLLSRYPDVEAYVTDAILSVRGGTGTINSILIASFFRGYVRAKYPDLFKQYSFSRAWCRRWFGQTFDWSYKRGTTSGQKLPVDWEDQRAAMVHRVAATAAQHSIRHPCFIINWDQTGCVLLSTSKYTYADKKSKQVPMVGQDDKRQITAVVASTLEGEMLPLQLIFMGQDHNKKEQRAVPKLSEVTTRRVRDWHLTQTVNHWSSLESMKDYIRLIIKKWVEMKAAQHSVTNPHVILLIDCWSVHTSAAFREWMRNNYPTYHVLFVPANCTSKAQPADAGLQKPFKNGITNAFNAWMADEIFHLVKGGQPAAEVRVDTGIKRLKPLMVHWTWCAWDKLKRRPDVVTGSWDQCGLGGVLTSDKQVEALRFCMSRRDEEPGVEPDAQLTAATDSDEEEDVAEGMRAGPESD